MPIQYTPQFIPTDINLMNRMLQERQQEHDLSLARIAEMEDKYGQMRVDPSDIEYKNQLLGNFQQDIGSIVDRYGGDYGAASKDITRKLSKFRNDPFFQNAPYKAQLIEEARKREAQLGPNAVNIRGVNDLRNLDISQPIDPESFKYDIRDIRDYEKALDTNYGDIKTWIRESGLQGSDVDGLLQSTEYRGLMKNEVPQYAGVMSQYLQEQMGLPKEYADRLGENKAVQLYQGSRNQFMRDPGFNPADDQNMQQGKNYILSTGEGDVTGYSLDEAKSKMNEYSQAMKEYSQAKKEFDLISKREKGTRTYSQMKDDQFKSDLYKQSEIKLNKIKEEFSGDMYNELTKKHKLSDEEAIATIISERSSKPITHPTEVRPSAEETISGITRDLNANLREVDLEKVVLYDSTGGRKEKSSDSVEKSMKEAIANGDIQDVKINVKSGEMKLISKDGNSYGIPVSSLKNKQVSKNLNSYNKIISSLNAESSNTSDKVKIGDNSFIADKRFNPESGVYESNLYLVDDKTNTKYKVPVEQFNDIFFSGLFSTYGQEGQYKKTYLNK